MDGNVEVGDPGVRDPEVKELNATQASLLGLLYERPATGWDLLEEARRGLARFWNITSSHVYRELKTLETRGLVRAGAPGPRDRRPFSITASGRDEFARWIRQEPGHEQMRIPLLIARADGINVCRKVHFCCGEVIVIGFHSAVKFVKLSYYV